MTMERIKHEEIYDYTCNGCGKREIVTAEYRQTPQDWIEFRLDNICVQSVKGYCGELPDSVVVHVCSHNCMNSAMLNVGQRLLDLELKYTIDERNK